MTFNKACIATLLCLLGAGPAVQAQQSPPDTQPDASSEQQGPSVDDLGDTADMATIITLLRQQQAELTAQKKLLEEQSAQITELNQEIAVLREVPADLEQKANTQLAAQRRQLESQAAEIATLTRELDTLRKPPPTEALSEIKTEEEPEVAAVPEAVVTGPPSGPVTLEEEVEQEIAQEEKAKETGEKVAKAQADDPTRALLQEFQAAWRLPGTSAALRFGGFVKTAVVYSNDPLQIKDRFIVGSIPVGKDDTTGEESQTSVTADQSRLNFDLRQPTNYGIMRAFIEGDFAGNDESFRLRHAFGQWNHVITGKTWTTFMDPDASPEEIDFEGLNGRINVRQAQVRWMPRFGEQYELQLSLEDPDPEIENGNGLNRTPDIVIAGRFNIYKRLHTKLALISREIRGQTLDGDVEKKHAWGTSISGNIATPRWDERDKLLFQLNFGNGIGRYVNDLSSIGEYDGIFNPNNDALHLFDVTAGYVSWQHWWGINQLRSNFTFGGVEVDNPDFVGDDAYKSTIRFSSNLIWSPISRIDLGGEYLWGQRQNEDGSEGDASQVQFAVKYRF